MTWLLWRQHRSHVLVTVVGTCLFAIAVGITGVHMAHIYKSSLAACMANGTCNLVGNLFSGYGAIIDLVHLSIVLPVILGAFVGATLVAREREQATNVLVWTQTVTRRRWLYSKIAAVLAGTVVASAVVSALVTWWSNTPNALDGNRFEGAQFDTQNVLPIALAIFAVALGISAGSLLRRTLPALATTVGAYVGVRLLVSVYLRPHYLKPITRSFPLNGDAGIPSGSWTMKQGLVDAAGRPANGPIRLPSSCGPILDKRAVDGCLGRLGFHQVVTYQPPSHYWPFQWIESGIFVGLAAVLITVAVVYTLRRDA
jgi:hypothetical protein